MTGESDITKEDLEALTSAVADVRAKLEEEGEKRDKRIKTAEDATAASIDAARKARNVAIGAVLVGLIGIAVGGFGLKATQDANSDRKQRTVASCQQYNIQQANQAQAEKDEERERRAASSVSITPILDLLNITKAEYDALQAERLKKFDATVDRAHKLRDCSPEGIKAYFAATTTTKGTP